MPALARLPLLRLTPSMIPGLLPRLAPGLCLALLLAPALRAELPRELANPDTHPADAATPAGESTAPAQPAAPAPAAPAETGNRPLALVFVTSKALLAENFPKPAEFSGWIKPAMAAVEEILAAEAKAPGVLVQIVFTPDRAPQYELAGRPLLAPELEQKLRARLAALPDLRAPLCTVCVRLQTPAGTNSPLTEAGLFIPRVFPPEEAALNRFIAADLATQYRELCEWSRNYALPLLAHHAAAADPQYEGVVNLGHRLLALPSGTPVDTDALTYHNPDFWRGIMEMAPGDLLVDAMPMLLHASAGELDRASTLLGVLTSFSRDGTLAREIINEFAARMGPFRRQLTAQMQEGVAFHDQRKFDKAIAQYDQVLAAYPNSAWALYEHFFATVSRDGLDTKKKAKRAAKLWDQAAPAIYRANPLYTSQFGATRGINSSALFDRLTLYRLSNKPPADFGERLGNFADSALRLGDYGTAALIYWSSIGIKEDIKGISFANDEPVTLTKEDVLARYLYCLEKLGVPQWKGEFESDYTPVFKQLDGWLNAHRNQKN